MAIRWQSWMRGWWNGFWNPEKGEQRSDPGGGGTLSGTYVTDTLALQISAAFRCIRIIAETCASLPICAYRRVGAYDREPLENDHWLSRLIREPNETMAGDEWAESMYGQMAGWGNAYSQIVPNSEGRTVELWPYKVDRMEVQRLENLTLQYKYPDVYGVPRVLTPRRVLHLRAFSLDGVMGLSPLGLARESLGLAYAAEKYAGSFFASGGRPSGVMTSEKLLTDKQREQLRKEYGGMADGSDGKRFWLLEAALKYQAISVSPEDMQMLQTRAFEVSEIARFFGVPLFLLMETEKSTSWGTGIEQQNLAFLTYTLRPYLQRMENTFNRVLIPERERQTIFVEVDTTPLQTADFTSLANFLSTGVQNGYILRNEARRRLKYPGLGAIGDVPMAQVNLAPLEQLGNLTPEAVEKMRRLQQMNELGQDPRVVPFSQRTGTGS